MKFVSRWLINSLVAGIGIILVPGFTLSGYIFPALGFLLAGFLVTLITPDMLDCDKALEGVQFFLTNFLFNLPIFMIIAAVTPGLHASGFIPNIVPSLLSALANTILQFKFKKINPAKVERDFSSDF